MKIKVFGTDQNGISHEIITDITDELREMAIGCNPDPEDDPDWHEPVESKICSYLAMEYTFAKNATNPEWYFAEYNYEVMN